MSSTGRVAVERLGGMAGFGLPGGHLRSRGEVELAALSATDRAMLDTLFEQAPAPALPSPDGFRYRLTRQDASGAQSVEVLEADLPQALRDCVKDTLD